VRKERLPLVGREVELSRLDQWWQATCSGQRHLVLVAGEPGIGKSRLAAEFARTAHGGGAPVVFGRCDEGMGVPYQPFVEALSRYLRQTSRPILGRLAGDLVRLDPDVGKRVHGLSPPLRSDPETERYRLFDAVAAWLSAVSETAPVLFVIEDLHWATKPTLLLLSHLLRSDEDLRLLLLVTFRDTPLDMSPDLADLVAELLRQPGVERLRLTGLDEPGVGALMEAQAGHDLDHDGRALARIVHGETAGNPFYVREMLSLLAEKGNIFRRDGRWVPGLPLAHLDVPDSVRDVVERRLTRLPDQTSEILAAAAVLGERFDLAVLAKASGDSETSVVETLRPAVSARLVAETHAGRYQFIHALVRSALEDALGPTRRLQLHRAAGSAIEAVHAGHLDDHLPALAHHWARASAPAADTTRAVEYATRAGDRALAQLAHDEAVGYYRQALELLDAANAVVNEHQRCDLLLSLGEAQRRAGDPAHRDTLLQAARLAQRLTDHQRLIRSALANSRGLHSTAGGVDTEKVLVLEAALAASSGVDGEKRARLLATLGVELAFSDDPQRAQRLSDEALETARRLADPATVAHVLLPRYFTIAGPENLPERLDNTAELLAVTDQLKDPQIRSRAVVLRFRALMEAGRVDEADRFIEEAERLTADLGQPTVRWFWLYHRFGRLLLAGQLEEADHLSHHIRELGTASGQPDAGLVFMLEQLAIRFAQGRLGEREALLLDVVAKYPVRIHLTQGLLAVLYCETGRADEARRHLGSLDVPELSLVQRNSLWILDMVYTAIAVAHLGDVSQARLLLDILAPYADQFSMTGGVCMGSVAHYLGLLAAALGRWDEAESRFAAAAETHERIGAPTFLALTRLEWARMLLARRQPGGTDRAGELLGQALATARELGLANVERQAVGLMT
jgi:tetratricopeptide (TPR) repeat protein